MVFNPSSNLIKTMTQTQEQKFQEWLQSCPVEYHLLDSDYDQQSYQFIVQSEEEE